MDLSLVEVQSHVKLPGIMDPGISTRILQRKGNQLSSCARNDDALMPHSNDRSRSRNSHATAAHVCTIQCQGTFSKSPAMQKPVGKRSTRAADQPSNPMIVPGEKRERHTEHGDLNVEAFESLRSGWIEEQERLARLMQHDSQTTSELNARSEHFEELTRQVQSVWKQRQALHGKLYVSRRRAYARKKDAELEAQRIQLWEIREEFSAQHQCQPYQTQCHSESYIGHTQKQTLNNELHEKPELWEELGKQLEEMQSELHSTRQDGYGCQNHLQASIHMGQQESNHLQSELTACEQKMAEHKVSHETCQAEGHRRRQQTEMLIKELRAKDVHLQSSAEHYHDESEKKDAIMRKLFHRNQTFISLNTTDEQERLEMSDRVEAHRDRSGKDNDPLNQ